MRCTAVQDYMLRQGQDLLRSVQHWFVSLGLKPKFIKEIGLDRVVCILCLLVLLMLTIFMKCLILKQGGCRTGIAKVTNAYDLPAR